MKIKALRDFSLDGKLIKKGKTVKTSIDTSRIDAGVKVGLFEVVEEKEKPKGK